MATSDPSTYLPTLCTLSIPATVFIWISFGDFVVLSTSLHTQTAFSPVCKICQVRMPHQSFASFAASKNVSTDSLPSSARTMHQRKTAEVLSNLNKHRFSCLEFRSLTIEALAYTLLASNLPLSRPETRRLANCYIYHAHNPFTHLFSESRSLSFLSAAHFHVQL